MRRLHAVRLSLAGTLVFTEGERIIFGASAFPKAAAVADAESKRRLGVHIEVRVWSAGLMGDLFLMVREGTGTQV